MRILFIVGRERSYSRNEVVLRALQQIAEVEVIAPDQPPTSLPRTSLQLALRAAKRLSAASFDLVFIGFYGFFLLQLLRPFLRTPVLFDAFVSNFDTLCFDRQNFKPDSALGRVARWLDRSSCQVASHILLDTEQHIDYFVKTFDLPKKKFSAIPVGCSEEIFIHQPYQPQPAASLQILGYCTYLPLHGVDTIVRAAALLRDQPLHFRLIGAGPLYAEMRQLALDAGATNITFVPTVPLRQLPSEIADADLCLGGHFGASAKAMRVIPGKIYQMLAVGRAIVAANSPGNLELLTHAENAWLIPPANPTALAEAILHLQGEPGLRQSLATQGALLFRERCSEAVIAQLIKQIVDAT